MLALFGRPDSWNWLLMFHVLGALVLVGAALAVTATSLLAVRTTDAALTTLLRRVAFRTNLALVLPGFVAAIVLGGALADKEYDEDTAPDWLEAAFSITFLAGIVGGILLTLLQWWVLRRARAGETRGWQAQTASYVAPLVLAALLVVLFLMSAKPD